MKTVPVKMPEWMRAALKHKAGERGVAAYVRELIVRDLSLDHTKAAS